MAGGAERYTSCASFPNATASLDLAGGRGYAGGVTRDPTPSPLTWALALVFLALLDGVVTRTSVLWGPTAFEHTRDIRKVVFAQTYQAARKLYATRSASPARIALLGNSRIWLAARETFLQPELARLAPGPETSVYNLGIFGAGLGDMEVVSRHLGRVRPSLVVLAIGSSDLLATPSSPLEGLPARLLRVGWADGPLPPRHAVDRLDRWARTVWPLYRFHEFARAALEDRLVRPARPEAFPDHVRSTRAIFAYMHGKQAAAVEQAYRAWRARPSLAAFVDYLRVGSSGHVEMVRNRVREATLPSLESPAGRVLDALLARLAANGWRAVVLLMPENPLLDGDVAGEYHVAGFSAAAADVIRTLAARHHFILVDARRWLPAEAFLDLDHVLPELSGFQRPLAAEIVRALRS